MDLEKVKAKIQSGQTALGIELGSTRIKAVLMTDTIETVATGSFNWENRLENGVWTYDLAEAWQGIQSCYRAMAASVQEKYGIRLEKIGAMGVSAMMHGYLPFNAKDELLVPFRTWRNNITGQAADELTEALGFNIPQRWSIAHLYQAILNDESHVKDIDYFTTLAGYIHWTLTGEKVLGIGEASGMFPIDSTKRDYDADMIAKFDALPEVAKYPWKLAEILPKVLMAGEKAGTLTEEGA